MTNEVSICSYSEWLPWEMLEGTCSFLDHSKKCEEKVTAQVEAFGEYRGEKNFTYIDVASSMLSDAGAPVYGLPSEAILRVHRSYVDYVEKYFQLFSQWEWFKISDTPRTAGQLVALNRKIEVMKEGTFFNCHPKARKVKGILDGAPALSASFNPKKLGGDGYSRWWEEEQRKREEEASSLERAFDVMHAVKTSVDIEDKLNKLGISIAGWGDCEKKELLRKEWMKWCSYLTVVEKIASLIHLKEEDKHKAFDSEKASGYLDDFAFQKLNMSISLWSAQMRDRFKEIEVLDLSRSHLTALPPIINKLESLKSIDLSHNFLSSISFEEGALSKLETLSLECNGLVFFPSELYQLPALKTVDLSSNKILFIPEWIGEMKSLQKLNVMRNFNLTYVPEKMESKAVIYHGCLS